MRVIGALLFLVGFSDLFANSANLVLTKVENDEMKWGRYGAATVKDENFLYVSGGSSDNVVLGSIERFNLQTREIEVLPHSLPARRYHGAALISGKIYVFGGTGYDLQSMQPTSDVDVYDLSHRTLSKAAPQPHARRCAGAVVVNGIVYVIGGTYVDHERLLQTNRVELFDAAQNRWSDGPPMPTPRECQAVAVGNLIFVAGGFLENHEMDVVEAFDTKSCVWVRLPKLCRNMSATSIAYFSGRLFLFGDYDDRAAVVTYDLQTGASRMIRPGFTPARHTSAIVANQRIYVFGGNVAANSPKKDIQVFALAPSS